MLKPAVVALACAATLLAPASLLAGAPKCRADDPGAAADAGAVESVRDQIDAACPCASFPPDGKKSLHGKYVKCAKAVVKAAVDADELRSQCKKLALYRAALSTCGYPTDPARGPCLKTTNKGPTCKIAKLAKCASPKVPCAVHATCLAAADTNHDGQVSALDSGDCNPLQDCDTVNPTQPQIDNAVITCFDTCLDPLTFQECIIGCAAGGNMNPAATDAFRAICEADPTLSCDDLHTAYLDACDAVPPSPFCDTCFTDPTCEGRCNLVADCTGIAGMAYDNCLAQTGN